MGPKKDELTGEWRRLHTGELCDLYCSQNIIRATKSRKMRWARHVAYMGDRRGAYKILVGKPEGNYHLKDLDADGRVLLKRIFEKRDG